jgi:glutaredoxin
MMERDRRLALLESHERSTRGQSMEQRCHLSMVWLTWLGLPLLAFVVGLRVGLVGGVAVLAVGIAAQVLYLRWFPYMSRWMGYGSVQDSPALPVPPAAKLPRVTLYTANVCPFCPIIRRRLAELQRQSPFELTEIDVTFRPDVIRAKGLRSVPVLEASGRLLVGNATSAQIAEFLKASAAAPAAAR